MALLETLQDNFDGTTLHPRWIPEYTGTTNGGVSVSGGTLNLITFTGSDIGTVCRVTTADTYTFTDSYLLARVIPDVNTPAQIVNLKIRPPTGAEYFLMSWGPSDLNIEAKDNTGADIFTPFTVAYNNVTMTYWRIRHTAGNLYFETTPDAITWTVHKTVAYTPAAAAYHAEMGTSWTAVPSAGRSSQFDRVNLPPQPMAALVEDFPGTALNPLKWTSATAFTAVTVNVAGGTLNFDTVVKPSSNHSGTVTSADTFLFTNTSLTAQVFPTTVSTAPATALRVRASGGSEEFQIIRSGVSNLTLRGYNTAGAQFTALIITYSASSMAWWRIRHTGTVMYWETAPAEVGPWTIQRQATYTPAIYTYNAVLDFTWNGATTATTPANVTRFDNINNFPSYSIIDGETIGAPSALPTAPPMETLTDAFDTMGQWYRHGTGSNPDVTGGTLNLVTAAGITGGTLGGVTSVGLYDLTDSYVYVKVNTTGSTSIQSVYLTVINPSNPKEQFQIYKLSTSLWFRGYDPTGSVLLSTSTPYVAATHAWWRIRHTTGFVYWETSSDSVTWTIRASSPYDPATRAMQVRLETGFSSTSTATTMRFDNVNIGTALRPDPITHPEQLGPPTVAAPQPDINPDPIVDAETLDAPTIPAGPQLIETVQDDFNGTTLHPQWTPTTTTGGAITVAGGLLNLNCSAASSTALARIDSTQNVYTLTGSAAYVRVSPNANTSVNTRLKVYNTTGSGYAQMTFNTGGVLGHIYSNTNALLATKTQPYNLVTLAYWRIRMDAASTVYLEYSSDAATWTLLISAGNPGWGASTRVILESQNQAARNGVAVFDSINTAPTAFADTVTDDFLGTSVVAATIDTTKWSVLETGGGTVTVGNGVLRTATSDTDTNSTAQLSSARSDLNILGSWVMATDVSASPVVGVRTLLRIAGGGNTLSMGRDGANLVWYLNTNAPASLGTYSAASHKHWRMTVTTAGLVTFQYSADGATWSGATTTTIAWGAAVSIQFLTHNNAAAVTGDSTIDAFNMLGTGSPTASPDPIAETETFDDPTLAFTAGTPSATPDPIADPEQFGDPDAVVGDDSLTPDSIIDAEEIIAPDDVTAVDDTTPDPIVDPETLGDPTSEAAATVTPDSITDPETFGPPTPIRNNNVVTPDPIVDPETLGDVQALVTAYPSYYPNSIIDVGIVTRPDSLIFRELSNWNYGAGIYNDGPYSGSEPIPEPPPPDEIDNVTYGTGTYGYGIYYGVAVTPPPDTPEPAPLLSDNLGYGQPPLHILGIGPWSATIVWRGLPNYDVHPGKHPARPALALPPATSKGFTLRLAEGSEARIDLSMRRGEAIIIDEMDTDLWWRRKDPRTKQLEVIGRFNCAHIEMATSDTGVSLSAQFEDYVTVLGARLVLKYRNPEALPDPTSMWDINTPVTDILAFALPDNTGLDLTAATGPNPYPLGKIIQPYHLPPGTSIADVMSNLDAISPVSWEWWIETPTDVNLPPKLRFTLGERGSDKGVTLLDAGSGPSPIAAWNRNGASDNYANSLYYTGSGTGEGANAGGGVVEDIPAQIEQYGQRDAQFGSTTQGGVIAQIRAGAVKKLRKLADRTPTYTVTLAHGFWRGRSHIDVGDTVTMILRLGKELIVTKYRVSEIVVNVDDNGMEDVTLTLGTPRASSDPRSSQSPIMRMLRALKNYEAPNGALDIPPPEE